MAVDPQEICDLLTSMLAADPVATHALLVNRVPCNRALLDHPSIMVDSLSADDSRPVVGLLGVLNGLCYTGPGCPVVGMMFDPPSRKLVGFRVVTHQPAPADPPDVDRSGNDHA
jgi:hypothetical protein